LFQQCFISGEDPDQTLFYINWINRRQRTVELKYSFWKSISNLNAKLFLILKKFVKEKLKKLQRLQEIYAIMSMVLFT